MFKKLIATALVATVAASSAFAATYSPNVQASFDNGRIGEVVVNGTNVTPNAYQKYSIGGQSEALTALFAGVYANTDKAEKAFENKYKTEVTKVDVSDLRQSGKVATYNITVSGGGHELTVRGQSNPYEPLTLNNLGSGGYSVFAIDHINDRIATQAIK